MQTGDAHVCESGLRVTQVGGTVGYGRTEVRAASGRSEYSLGRRESWKMLTSHAFLSEAVSILH